MDRSKADIIVLFDREGGKGIARIQMTENVAQSIARALRTTEEDAECRRIDALDQADQRRRVVVSKLDRGYEDFLEGRISEAFWTRKSQDWEQELQTIDRERARLQQPSGVTFVKVAKILELAKQAENLYKSQIPTERRRLLDVVLSNCTFDRGSLSPLTLSRSIYCCEATKLEIGGEGGIRTHVPLTGQDAFEAPPLRPLRYLSAWQTEPQSYRVQTPTERRLNSSD